MKIVVTPNELLDKDIWGDACRMLGLNEYSVNEGLIDSNEELILSEDQARELKLLQCSQKNNGSERLAYHCEREGGDINEKIEFGTNHSPVGVDTSSHKE